MASWLDLVYLLASTLRLSTPLIFACLAGLWAERSGVFDIGLEGKLLISAFAAAVVAGATGSAWAGLAAGIVASILAALVHAYASIDQRADQVVSGTAINIAADGGTALLGNALFSQGGRTPSLSGAERFHDVVLPGADVFSGVPFVGPVYKFLLSGQSPLVYAAFLVAPLTWWALTRTRFGLRLRAVGDNPAAVDTAGVSVRGLRYRALIVCGALCGFGGAYLSVGQAAFFLPHMSAGKGFIALAALVFSNWRPMRALATCLLFGFLDALSTNLQGADVPFVGAVPVQFFQALPYLLTIVLLAGFIGKATPPKAGGRAYVKER
ncbi:MAG: ABC transporter permease [Hyphomicrobiales bacterium]|nr:ABC transporter permease [Hyphomicrobiales bacterium]